MSADLASKKISFKEGTGFVEITITGKIERWQEALLTAWMAAWAFVGIAVMREYAIAVEREMRLVLAVFLIFWGYYFWKVGRTWAYRIAGHERIRIEGNTLMLKRSFFRFGKERKYDVVGIKDFEPIKLSKTSATFAYENGWWVLGGERIAFLYQGKAVKFAMQIPDREATDVYQLLHKKLKRAKKAQN